MAATPTSRGKIPASSIKSLRGSRRQADVALKANISQQHLSRLEYGTRDLTPETAVKLGPALGVSPTELWVSEQTARLNKLALKGEVSPHLLLEAILELAKATPDTEVGDALVSALMQVLRDAMERAEEEDDVTARGSDESEDEDMMMPLSMKSRKQPTRDNFGRRIQKPHGGS
jgi:plasmid maintenance system antidote protein VapI